MFVAFMLVHLFWLFEFKFGFEFKCLISFRNQQNLFHLIPHPLLVLAQLGFKPAATAAQPNQWPNGRKSGHAP
jgi:hypothetical protein